jgi:hypothetical protein
MRVRVPEIPAVAADLANPGEGSAFTRAIPRKWIKRQAHDAKNFASREVTETRAAAAASWFGRERPPSLYDTAANVAPAKGEAGNAAVWAVTAAAGVIRLVALSLLYLAVFCFATRVRAAASTAVLAAVAVAHQVAR